MKKTFSFLAIITCIAYTAVAQKITFAVSAGGSYANTFIKEVSKEPEGLGSKPGFTGGISANISFSKYFSFQPGINYVQKGFKKTQDQATSELTIDYLEVPLNLMFNTRNKDKDNRKADDFFFGIGPSVSFGTSGKMAYKNDSVKLSDKVKFGSSDNDNIKRVDFGANIVMGCMFFNNFFFSINYNMGLRNLSNLSGEEYLRWRNNYLGFKVGYSFGGHKK
jgi:hypothetical protein